MKKFATKKSHIVSQSMKNMTDQELFKAAKNFGKNALLWRRKFIGLLPEINRRRLWEKKGFTSIFEFSKKLCGLSEKQIRLTLNLEKRFEDKPNLKNLLTSGEVSINKLARVVSIATIENEEDLAEAVKVLPNRAVEKLVKDEKQNGLHKPSIEAKSLHVQTLESSKLELSKLELSKEVTERLFELKEKGMDINKILLELLRKREREIREEKEAIAKNLPTTSSRHIPAKILRVIRKEHGAKCSIPSCKNRAQHIHHTQTFALSKRHDPRFLAPLCKSHHQIAHSINLKFAEKLRVRVT